MEDRLTALQAEKEDLQRRLDARRDNLCFQQNCRAIAARLVEVDAQIAQEQPADGG